MEDTAIVDMYLRRDECAVTETAEKYGHRLRGLAFGITEDAQTAEECENDTYFQAWNAIPPHEPRSYLYQFLARITRHLSLDACRSRSRLRRSAHITELSAELEQCIPAPDDAECRIMESELKAAINGFLAGLNEEKRNIFLRRYWYLDSVAAISRRFGISESKVKTTLHRCRRQLKEYLEKEGYTI